MNKTTILLLLITFTISACEKKKPDIRVHELFNTCRSNERANWTATCIKDANPKSDEEPEDWISKCNQVSREQFCPNQGSRALFYRENSKWHPCSNLTKHHQYWELCQIETLKYKKLGNVKDDV